MPPFKTMPPPDADEAAIDEARMRRALGLDSPNVARSSWPRPDPVHRRPSPHSRESTTSAAVSRVPPAPATGEVELRDERRKRAAAEHSLEAAQATIQDLLTRLAHAEMATAEAHAAGARIRDEAEQTRQSVPADDPVVADVFGTSGTKRTEPGTARAKPVRPLSGRPVKPIREPEPVKWWLPGYGASWRRR